MELTNPKAREERRKTVLEPTEVGAYSPGIIRIERQAEQALKEHDEVCNSSENPDWFKDYSLYEHALTLNRLMARVGGFRKRTPRLISVGSEAGLLHDIGKLDESCHIHRLNRKLMEEERKIINRHADFSGEWILRELSNVRFGDRGFLLDVHLIVRFHHAPWHIPSKELREVAYDLKYNDFFASRMEKRHRPGLSQFQALFKLCDFVEEEKKDPQQTQFAEEMQDSLDAIIALYGIPNEVECPRRS